MDTWKKQPQKAGLDFETPVHMGEWNRKAPFVMVCGYDENTFWEKQTDNLEELGRMLTDTASVLWVHLEGLTRLDFLQKIGSHYGLHQLTLEDVLNTARRPKQESYEGYTYIVLKFLSYNDKDNNIEISQVSLILGEGFVVTVCEDEWGGFEAIRKRIETHKNAFHKMGADYLAYSLLDIIVDDYFAVLEKIGEKLGGLEEALLVSPDEKVLQAVHAIKRELLGMRQAVWPLREALAGLEQSEVVFVQHDILLHLRDVYSHTVQIIDTIEIYREILSGMLEIYLSSINNKLNEVMKVLTIFAAIFIPLTLISGIYGMNFKYMPELNWLYGYPMAIGLMVMVAAIMLLYFKRKKWL